MKNILIINGHPAKDSFSLALAEAYQIGAKKSGATTTLIHLADLDFGSPFLHNFQTKNESKDLKYVQNLISENEHLVVVYPTWWYLPPANVKAFFEHVFLPGFAFKYKENPNRVTWESYLKGKTAHLISTMDAPPFFYKLFIGNPGGKAMKAALSFCGIKMTKQTYFGSVKLSNENKRKKWLNEVEELGKQLR